MSIVIILCSDHIVCQEMQEMQEMQRNRSKPGRGGRLGRRVLLGTPTFSSRRN